MYQEEYQIQEREDYPQHRDRAEKKIRFFGGNLKETESFPFSLLAGFRAAAPVKSRQLEEQESADLK